MAYKWTMAMQEINTNKKLQMQMTKGLWQSLNVRLATFATLAAIECYKLHLHDAF